jgi:hypothetical protein
LIYWAENIKLIYYDAIHNKNGMAEYNKSGLIKKEGFSGQYLSPCTG